MATEIIETYKEDLGLHVRDFYVGGEPVMSFELYKDYFSCYWQRKKTLGLDEIVEAFEESYKSIKEKYHSSIGDHFTCVFSQNSNIEEFYCNRPFQPSTYKNPDTGAVLDAEKVSFLRINTSYVDFWADLMPQAEDSVMLIGMISNKNLEKDVFELFEKTSEHSSKIRYENLILSLKSFIEKSLANY